MRLFLKSHSHFSAVIITPLRMFEFVMTGTELGTSLLVDSSLILVPMISVWGTIPLFYFLLVEGLIGFYCVELRRQLHGIAGRRRHSLKFFYKKFIDICDLQVCVFFACCGLFHKTAELLRIEK
jgi:hypothetical protein